MTSDIEQLIEVVKGLKDLVKTLRADVDWLKKENANLTKRVDWLHARVTAQLKATAPAQASNPAPAPQPEKKEAPSS